jgi:hypothetical protein
MTGENCIQFGLPGMCRAAREVLFQPLGMLSIQVLPHPWPLDSFMSCNFPVKTNQTCQTPNWFTSGQESFLPPVRLWEDVGGTCHWNHGSPSGRWQACGSHLQSVSYRGDAQLRSGARNGWNVASPDLGLYRYQTRIQNQHHSTNAFHDFLSIVLC